MRYGARAVAAFGLALLLAACSGSPVREAADEEKSANLNAELGLRYMLQGKHALALEKLERALEFQPGHPAAHHYMAELYRRLGKSREAEIHYRESLESAPGDNAVRNNYAVFLCSIGRLDEAENQFVAVLKDPVYNARAEAYENLGLCLQRKPEPEKAEFYFRQALRLEPRLAKSLVGMTRISVGKGDYLAARGYLQRYAAVARHTPETLWLGIRIERQLGDRDALASYGLLLKGNFPDSPEAELYRSSEREHAK